MDPPFDADGEVRNVVDAGADPAGERPIDDVLASLADEDVVCYFPEGRYLLDGFESSAPGLELRGRNATVVPTGGRTELAPLIRLRGAGSVIDGFEFEMGGCGLAPRIDLYADDWRLSNVVFRGRMGVGGFPEYMAGDVNGVSALNVAVTDPEGVGRIDTVYMPDGACAPGRRDNRRAIFLKADAEASHRGRLELRRWWAENWCENTFYGDYGAGTVHFEECFVRNSPIGLRVPGGSSFVRCTIVKDGPVPWQRASLWDRERYAGQDPGTNRTRGIWLRGGNNPYTRDDPVEIRDCDLVFTDDSEYTMGQPIVLGPPSRTTRIESTRIRLAVEAGTRHDRWPAVALTRAGEGDEGVPRPTLELRDVQIASTSERKPAVVLARDAEVAAFTGTVRCPAGIADPPSAATGPNASVSAGDPDPADQTPPMPAPPERGTTPNAR